MIIQDLKNRLIKRSKQLLQVARKQDIMCYRIYDKDLPDYPFILDRYGDHAIVWIYERKIDDSPERKIKFDESVITTILDSLGIQQTHLHIKHRSRQRGLTTQYQKSNLAKPVLIVKENHLHFEVNLTNYLDTGLFLDHRLTRLKCKQMAAGKRVLNLFSYTGSFSCYAIAGHALSTTSVDMSNEYSKWTARNFDLNGFSRSADRIITANCFSFLKQELSRNRYDLIICDPPTFSNSKKMKRSFSVDHDHLELLRDCLALLAPSGTIIFSTNSRRFKLSPHLSDSSIHIQNVTDQTIPFDFKSGCHSCWTITRN